MPLQGMSWARSEVKRAREAIKKRAEAIGYSPGEISAIINEKLPIMEDAINVYASRLNAATSEGEIRKAADEFTDFLDKVADYMTLEEANAFLAHAPETLDYGLAAMEAAGKLVGDRETLKRNMLLQMRSSLPSIQTVGAAQNMLKQALAPEEESGLLTFGKPARLGLEQERDVAMAAVNKWLQGRLAGMENEVTYETPAGELVRVVERSPEYGEIARRLNELAQAKFRELWGRLTTAYSEADRERIYKEIGLTRGEYVAPAKKLTQEEYKGLLGIPEEVKKPGLLERAYAPIEKLLKFEYQLPRLPFTEAETAKLPEAPQMPQPAPLISPRAKQTIEDMLGVAGEVPTSEEQFNRLFNIAKSPEDIDRIIHKIPISEREKWRIKYWQTFRKRPTW